jgi:hypothetical protein
MFLSYTEVFAQDSGDPNNYYLTDGRVLTDSDFHLYFQYMELLRQKPDKETMQAFIDAHQVDARIFISLATRINFGKIILDDPSVTERLVSAYGNIIVPKGDEIALFKKYDETIKSYQRNSGQ